MILFLASSLSASAGSVAASRAGSDGGSEMIDIDGSVDLSIGSDSSLTDRFHLWDNHQ